MVENNNDIPQSKSGICIFFIIFFLFIIVGLIVIILLGYKKYNEPIPDLCTSFNIYSVKDYLGPSIANPDVKGLIGQTNNTGNLDNSLPAVPYMVPKTNATNKLTQWNMIKTDTPGVILIQNAESKGYLNINENVVNTSALTIVSDITFATRINWYVSEFTGVHYLEYISKTTRCNPNYLINPNWDSYNVITMTCIDNNQNIGQYWYIIPVEAIPINDA